MTVFLRHFAHPHPLFRKTKTRSGIAWQESVYYLWWEYLRRHEGYKQTCEKKGRGRYAALYKSFGDVHTIDFHSWWIKNGRGAQLFAEPAVPISVASLTQDDLEQVRRYWDDSSMLIIAVPLNLPKRFIEQKMKTILDAHHAGKRGIRRNKESRALFPITNQFSFHSLQRALAVYDLKGQKPDLKLWEIAQQLKLTVTLDAEEIASRGKQTPTAIEKKNTMSVAVSRKLKQAETIIENVGKGLFPGPM